MRVLLCIILLFSLACKRQNNTKLSSVLCENQIDFLSKNDTLNDFIELEIKFPYDLFVKSYQNKKKQNLNGLLAKFSKRHSERGTIEAISNFQRLLLHTSSQ